MFLLGQVVFSKCGRDKGRPFIIVDMNRNFLFLANGSNRTVLSPKKKKQKHVQPTNDILPDIKYSILNDMHDKNNDLLDANIRKSLIKYIKNI